MEKSDYLADFDVVSATNMVLNGAGLMIDKADRLEVHGRAYKIPARVIVDLRAKPEVAHESLIQQGAQEIIA